MMWLGERSVILKGYWTLEKMSKEIGIAFLGSDFVHFHPLLYQNLICFKYTGWWWVSSRHHFYTCFSLGRIHNLSLVITFNIEFCSCKNPLIQAIFYMPIWKEFLSVGDLYSQHITHWQILGVTWFTFPL